MQIRRLGWAGVEVECDGETLVIDYVQDKAALTPFLRSPDEAFPESSRPGHATAALLTHLHADHADPDALAIALRVDAPVLRPEPASGNADNLVLTSLPEEKFLRQSLKVQIVPAWEQRTIGPFQVSSSPAVDGFGDPQISWIVECSGRRIFHAGDTLFHGFWWRIANRYGPVDLAFLPINGAVCEWPHLQPASPIEATLAPEQAAIAAHILGAKAVAPIHYRSLHHPPEYVETPHPTQRLEDKCKEIGIRAWVTQPGEWFSLDGSNLS